MSLSNLRNAHVTSCLYLCQKQKEGEEYQANVKMFYSMQLQSQEGLHMDRTVLLSNFNTLTTCTLQKHLCKNMSLTDGWYNITVG